MRLIKFQVRVLSDYLLATANEITIDEFIIRSLTVGRTPEDIGFFAKSGKVDCYFQSRFPLFVYLFSLIGRLVWIAGGCVVFLLS